MQTQRIPAHPGHAAAATTRRWNVIRDLAGAGLVVIALVLPWNLYFGLGVPDSKEALFALLGAVTLLSLLAVVVTYLGPWRLSSPRFKPALVRRMRVLLNYPYQLLVLGFIVFDVFQTIKSGGSVHVPGGVGPGAWLGIAGSMLGAQPVITGSAAHDASPGRWLKSAMLIGYASMLGATLSTVFNLCWRIRFALRGTSGSSDFGKQNIAVIATATVYGLVALAAVIVASRWLLRTTKASQLATVALGASTLVAGPLVWFLPVGRDIDAFHGIAQNTSTAGVGFEGYLAWAAAAAIFAPRALIGYRGGASDGESPWRAAARKGLVLIIVWCVGSVLMRATDLGVAVALNYPYSRYDTMTMAAFDLATAVLAIWLRINLANRVVSARLITSLCGLLVTFSIARVVVGVVLAPRFLEPPEGGGWNNPVYGNNLAQQITSVFDVVLCGLAIGIMLAAIITGQLSGRRLRRRKVRAAHGRNVAGPAAPAAAAVPPAASRPSAAPTTRIRVGAAGADMHAATTAMPQLAGSGSPRIFRGDDSATQQIRLQRPKIYRPPDTP